MIAGSMMFGFHPLRNMPKVNLGRLCLLAVKESARRRIVVVLGAMRNFLNCGFHTILLTCMKHCPYLAHISPEHIRAARVDDYAGYRLAVVPACVMNLL